MADLYREWARYEEAAPLYVQVLAIREKILGWESPSILKARQMYVAMLQIMEHDTEDVQGQGTRKGNAPTMTRDLVSL